MGDLGMRIAGRVQRGNELGIHGGQWGGQCGWRGKMMLESQPGSQHSLTALLRSLGVILRVMGSHWRV